ncbi:hypothetical protein BaRGS_00032540 [Batillaria attramentaria]|uniref:Uncharacterized protein n=1 Tax=Batillaria attramentaria TaxID=370345 RepID=A0ABD0JN20_9CAEN
MTDSFRDCDSHGRHHEGGPAVDVPKPPRVSRQCSVPGNSGNHTAFPFPRTPPARRTKSFPESASSPRLSHCLSVFNVNLPADQSLRLPKA